MNIQVPLQRAEDGRIVYPGDPDLWFNARPVGERLVGEYRGEPDFPFQPWQPPPAPGARIITNLAFDLRFSIAERVAIELAGIDDPSAAPEARTTAAYIRVSAARAAKAQYTDLDDPVTREGVQQFEAYGLIAQGRAAGILDAPVQPHEQPT